MNNGNSRPFDKAFLLSHPAHFIAAGFGSGLAPVAPGTFGTLAALPAWLLILQVGFAWQLIIIALAFVLGIWVCEKACSNLGVHDHGSIVWDEFVGLWITLVFVPFSWLNLLLGFALFRLFDVLKPFPIGWFDRRVEGGLGVMLDDVIAGLLAGCCLFVINYFLAG